MNCIEARLLARRRNRLQKPTPRCERPRLRATTDHCVAAPARTAFSFGRFGLICGRPSESRWHLPLARSQWTRPIEPAHAELDIEDAIANPSVLQGGINPAAIDSLDPGHEFRDTPRRIGNCRTRGSASSTNAARPCDAVPSQTTVADPTNTLQAAGYENMLDSAGSVRRALASATEAGRRACSGISETSCLTSAAFDGANVPRSRRTLSSIPART